MKIKNIWRLYPLIILVGIFSYFYFTGQNNRNKFYSEKIKCKIIDSNDWQKRTVEYRLENNLTIDVTVLDSITLKVGDSLSKESNSKNFDIYKKNTLGQYSFYKRYRIDK